MEILILPLSTDFLTKELACRSTCHSLGAEKTISSPFVYEKTSSVTDDWQTKCCPPKANILFMRFFSEEPGAFIKRAAVASLSPRPLRLMQMILSLGNSFALLNTCADREGSRRVECLPPKTAWQRRPLAHPHVHSQCGPVFVESVFRADCCVISPRRPWVGLICRPGFANPSFAPLKNSSFPPSNRRVFTFVQIVLPLLPHEPDPSSSGNQRNQSHCCRHPRRNHFVGQTTFNLHELSFCFLSDYAMKSVPCQGRVGSQGRALVGILRSLPNPALSSLIASLSVLLPTSTPPSARQGMRNTFSLSSHVFGTHVNHAFKTETGAHGSGCDSMLSGPGLGNDALLSHSLGKQGLSQGIVDLVGAGVKQVFPLEVNLCAAQTITESLRVI